MRAEAFVSVDCETDGPVPGDFSLLSIGAVVIGEQASFYAELAPISSRFDPRALAVSGLDRDRLARQGQAPEAAMRALSAWALDAARGRRLVFVGYNAPFDWMFTAWYLHHFTGANPFGVSALDIKSYAAGKLGLTRWSDAIKSKWGPALQTTKPHTHHAEDDAREQAELFERLRTA